MDIFGIFTMLGGLALFLYGMNEMGNGLAKISGGKLARVLERLTANRLMGVLLGAGVTAVIQSSSATTVMVVGFVNSGIMKLSQAVGVIMGANIGTTITSWILSLAGIEGGNFFIQLLKPSSFSPLLAAVGIVLMMFSGKEGSKRERRKDTGAILIGFAILMTGMETMSGAVKPLADVPEFTNILTMFSNPLLGLLAGALLTAVLQSSSASIGILQALCLTGSIGYGTALPIIMGQNIGTCVTALLSGIGANQNARRASLIHLYFNVIGTLLFMGIFYSVNAFVDFSFLDATASAVGIAVIHSAFNIFATVILFPFGNLLEKLACLTVGGRGAKTGTGSSVGAKSGGTTEGEIGIQMLDARFLETPAFAVDQCKDAAFRMAGLSREALLSSLDLLKIYDEQKAQQVLEIENKVDRYEDMLGSYLVKLSSKNLTGRDSGVLSMLLHCIGDWERISDHAVNLVQAAKEIYEKKAVFPEQTKEELTVFARAIEDIIKRTEQVFVTGDLDLARKVEPLEEVIDDLNGELKNRHIKRLRKGETTIELGFIFSDITTNCERIADHCSNIAVCLIEIHENEFETHGYLGRIKQEGGEFRRKYQKYQERYQLP